MSRLRAQGQMLHEHDHRGDNRQTDKRKDAPPYVLSFSASKPPPPRSTLRQHAEDAHGFGDVLDPLRAQVLVLQCELVFGPASARIPITFSTTMRSRTFGSGARPETWPGRKNCTGGAGSTASPAATPSGLLSDVEARFGRVPLGCLLKPATLVRIFAK
jgi:hypothetical protein